jgi:hypothetical protein
MEPRFVAGGRGSLVPLQRQSLRSGFDATCAAKRGLDLRPSMTVDGKYRVASKAGRASPCPAKFEGGSLPRSRHRPEMRGQQVPRRMLGYPQAHRRLERRVRVDFRVSPQLARAMSLQIGGWFVRTVLGNPLNAACAVRTFRRISGDRRPAPVLRASEPRTWPSQSVHSLIRASHESCQDPSGC